MVVAPTTQGLSARAGVEVLLGVVDEVFYGEQSGTSLLVCHRSVRSDARLLYGRYVLPCAVGGIPRNRARAKAPTEAASEEHLLHGEVLRNLRWRNQYVQDHARLTPVHEVVGQVAEFACALLVHGGGVGVCGAHPEIRHPPVAPPERLPLLAPVVLDPAVPKRVLSRELSPFIDLGSHEAGDDGSWEIFFLGERGVLGERASQVLLQAALHQRARPRGVDGGVGLDLGSVYEQLLAPHQPGRKALLDNPL